MKIDFKKIEKQGGKVIEYDPKKEYLIVVDASAMRVEDSAELAHETGMLVVLVNGPVDESLAMYEKKK